MWFASRICSIVFILYGSGGARALQTAVCGNGKLEASMIDSNLPLDCSSGRTIAEACDVRSDAKFGVMSGGCGVREGCRLNHTKIVRIETSTTHLKEQRQIGPVTDTMEAALDITWGNGYKSYVDDIAPCVYEPTGCNMTLARAQYSILDSCYDVSNISGPTFGKRNAADSHQMLEDGHKCPYPASIQVQAGGGEQKWGNERGVTGERMGDRYPLCFKLDNTAMWPSTSKLSRMFTKSSVVVSYSVSCESAVQDTAYASCTGLTNETCERLGGVHDSCAGFGTTSRLVSCTHGANRSCEALEKELNAPVYKMTISSQQADNPLGCTTHVLENTPLHDSGYATSDIAYNPYVGSMGAVPVRPTSGEGVGFVDTCTPLDELPSSVGGSGAYRKHTMGKVRGSADASSTLLDATFLAATEYNVGCDRQLMLEVDEGYSGSMMFSVITTVTATSVSHTQSGNHEGYAAKSKKFLPFSIMMVPRGVEPTDVVVQTPTGETTEGGHTNVAWQRNLSLPRQSPNTKCSVDYFDVTNSTDSAFVAELDATQERFTLRGAGRTFNDSYDAEKDYVYNESRTATDGIMTVTARRYQSPVLRGAVGSPDLLLGVSSIRYNTPTFVARTNQQRSKTQLDPMVRNYHSDMSHNRQVAMRALVSVWAPTSCRFSSRFTDEFYVKVTPSNPNPPEVTSYLSPAARGIDGDCAHASDQEQYVYEEDSSVRLNLQVKNTHEGEDSSAWYFSRLEVTNKHRGRDARDTAYANDFDLFVVPEGGPIAATGASRPVGVNETDTLGVAGSAGVFTSYSNAATRYIEESEAASTTNKKFGFGDVPMAALQGSPCESPAACLQAAQNPQTWENITLRPCRKCTKNVDIEVRVCMRDGQDPSVGEVCTSITKYMLFTPFSTRYNQNEFAQSKRYEVTEGSDVIIGERGGKPPLSYQADTKVCTFVDIETKAFYGSRTRDGSRASLTVPPTDRDKQCDTAADCTPIADNRTSVHCLPSGAAQDRILFDSIFAVALNTEYSAGTNRYNPQGPFNHAAHNFEAGQAYANAALSGWNMSTFTARPGAFYNILGADAMPNATWCDSFGNFSVGQPASCNALSEVGVTETGRVVDCDNQDNNMPTETTLPFASSGLPGWHIDREGTKTVPEDSLIFRSMNFMNTFKNNTIDLGFVIMVSDCVYPSTEVAALIATNTSKYCASSMPDQSVLQIDVQAKVDGMNLQSYPKVWSTSATNYTVESRSRWDEQDYGVRNYRPEDSQANHTWRQDVDYKYGTSANVVGTIGGGA